jgi:hypothetical protein
MDLKGLLKGRVSNEFPTPKNLITPFVHSIHQSSLNPFFSILINAWSVVAAYLEKFSAFRFCVEFSRLSLYFKNKFHLFHHFAHVPKLHRSRHSLMTAHDDAREQKIHRWRFGIHEDHTLTDMVTWHGFRSWSYIATKLPGRTARQCRDRWNHYLAKGLALDQGTPPYLVGALGVVRLPARADGRRPIAIAQSDAVQPPGPAPAHMPEPDAAGRSSNVPSQRTDTTTMDGAFWPSYNYDPFISWDG